MTRFTANTRSSPPKSRNNQVREFPEDCLAKIALVGGANTLNYGTATTTTNFIHYLSLKSDSKVKFALDDRINHETKEKHNIERLEIKFRHLSCSEHQVSSGQEHPNTDREKADTD